jgi:hypothetical protein
VASQVKEGTPSQNTKGPRTADPSLQAVGYLIDCICLAVFYYCCSHVLVTEDLEWQMPGCPPLPVQVEVWLCLWRRRDRWSSMAREP